MSISTTATPRRTVTAEPAAAAKEGLGTSASPPRRRGWRTALHAIPNLLVFSLLAGVFVLGHHTGWKMPKSSALWGAAPPAADDWCAEHLVPESQCIECNVELAPKAESFGFCWEHGVAECVTHHPELAQVDDRPQLPQYDTVQAIAVMARPENNSRDTLHTRRVQFASLESVAKSGIEVDVVQERPMADAIASNGELVFDPTRVVHLAARAPGTAAVVLHKVGDAVQPGDILALIDAAEVGQAKARLLKAIVQAQSRRATVERLRPVATGGAVPMRALVEAESALQEAEIEFISAHQALANLGFELGDGLQTADPAAVADQLRYLGIPAPLLDLLPLGTKTANLIPLVAPYAGVVVAAHAAAGEVVDSANALFTTADPRHMWLLLNVRQEEARYVRPGLPVVFRSDDSGQAVRGVVSWISPAVDEQTRTLQVRVAVDNADGALRDKTFGSGRIIVREEPRAVVVPREAVQSTSDAHFVFVRDKRYFDKDAPKFFHVRQVRLGAQDDQYVELLAGALPGEVVATRGSAALLAQLLRSNLGVGCGCHEN